MGEFHQHPDGLIYVREADKVYGDTRENFAADFGVLPPVMPDGADDHVYTQGRRHAYMKAGNVFDGGPMPWPEGDQIIANIDVGLAAQLARQSPQQKAVDLNDAATRDNIIAGSLVFNQENRLRVLEGKPVLTVQEFFEFMLSLKK